VTTAVAITNGKAAKSGPLPVFDADEVRRAIDLLIPAGQVTELRALDATTAGDRWPRTLTGYFADRDKLVESLRTIKDATSVYFTPNPVDPRLKARAANRIKKADKGDSTSDKDIIGRRWLLIDCDAIRPAGISATDEEHEAAIQRAKLIADELKFNYGWPEPIVGDSGNGGHVLYRVDLPTDDGGLVERCLKSLATKFDDDDVKVDTSVFNPARIWKLYGARVGKGDSTEDRPHRTARILSAPERLQVVPAELLESLASDSPIEQPAKHEHNSHAGGMAFDIDAFIDHNGFALAGPDAYQGGRKWTFNHSPMCDHHGDGPFLIQFANGALSAGCHHDSCSWTWHDLRAKYEPKQERRGMPDLRPAEYRDPPRDPEPVQFQRITSAELACGNYAVEFAIEGAMVLGQPLTIGGPMKSLKTSVLIDAAVSLAGGGFFLGRMKVNRPRRVLVMSGESGLATIQETARRICDAAGKNLAEFGNLIWSSDIPRFSRRDHLDALGKFLDDDGIEILFADPAYLAMPSADAGNLMAQGELLRNVADVCRDRNVTLVLCHHTKRNTGQDAFEPLELQHLAWAGHAEFARQWWLLNRRERYEPGTGEHKLWLSIGGSAGHGNLWALDVSEGLITDVGGRRWDVSLTDAAGAREAAQERHETLKAQAAEQRLEADCQKICEALAALPAQTGTKKDVREVCGLNTGRFGPALAALFKDKRVTNTAITKGNNRSYEAIKLNH
jgi:hypothetical protein